MKGYNVNNISRKQKIMGDNGRIKDIKEFASQRAII